jgi:hypothetical protein
MKRKLVQVLAVALGLAFAVAVQAQMRHDEKPHGPPKKTAEAKKKQVKRGTPGRHDERPHGPPAATKEAGAGNK